LAGSKADIPATKEPSGLLRTDGKRPDGITLLSRKNGRCATWDVTVTDTMAQSYLHNTSRTAGAAAETAVDKKTTKYALLMQTYVFVPIAVETMGAISSEGLEFLGDPGWCITQVTDNIRESAFACQFLFSATMRSPSRAPMPMHTTSEDEF